MIKEILEAKSFYKEIDKILDKHQYAYLELKNGEFTKADAVTSDTAYAYDKNDNTFDIDFSEIKRIIINKDEIKDLEKAGKIVW